jgi:DNA recombination protein RmuC
VSYGWEQAQLSQKAQEIQALGRDLHKRGALFLERFMKVGEKLQALNKQFEDAEITFNGRQGLRPQLQKFEEYGCKSEKRLPDAPAGLWEELPEKAAIDEAIVDVLPVASSPSKE